MSAELFASWGGGHSGGQDLMNETWPCKGARRPLARAVSGRRKSLWGSELYLARSTRIRREKASSIGDFRYTGTNVDYVNPFTSGRALI